jgi:hypothetical protein
MPDRDFLLRRSSDLSRPHRVEQGASGKEALRTHEPASLSAYQLQRSVGNRAAGSLLRGEIQRKPVQVSTGAGKGIQLDGGIKKGISRQLRIWKRQMDKKSLPNSVYRIDARDPTAISAGGFQPWKAAGNITIKEHVTGALDQALADGSTLAKYESQFVSTANYKGLADGVLANASMGKKLYKIDTNFAGINRASFTDVNDYFDRLGRDRPYPQQREWLKAGGIPGAAVTHYMDAPNFFQQCTFTPSITLPDEGSVNGWQAMP